MAGDRELAREHLASARDSDNEDAPVQAVIAIAFALLDVADAIREGRPAPDADIAKDYHTEAIESGVGVLEDICATLESVRTEVADLRCVVAKIGGR